MHRFGACLHTLNSARLLTWILIYFRMRDIWTFLLLIYWSDTRNLTREVVESGKLNITCRLILEGAPLVVWTKNNIPLKVSRNKYLVIERVNRSQSGNYACVSVAKSANQTSAITTVDVLCRYRNPKCTQDSVRWITLLVLTCHFFLNLYQIGIHQESQEN